MRTNHSRFNKPVRLENGATVRLIAGRCWLIFSPLAVRMFGLKIGQLYKLDITEQKFLRLTPVKRKH